MTEASLIAAMRQLAELDGGQHHACTNGALMHSGLMPFMRARQTFSIRLWLKADGRGKTGLSKPHLPPRELSVLLRAATPG